MGAITSQTTSITIVYSLVYSGADARKHESSASLAFVRGIHRGPVNSPHKRPVTRKMFPFDDVIMTDFMHMPTPLPPVGIWFDSFLMVWHYFWNGTTLGTLEHGVTLILAWISNCIHFKVWDEITHPFPNLNGVAVGGWEWMNNFIIILVPCSGFD